MQIKQTTEDSVASKAFRKHQGHTEGREAEPDVEGARKIRVLVVEDNASDSELMLHALKNAGYEDRKSVV